MLFIYHSHHGYPAKLINTSLQSFFKSRRLRWAGHVARMEKGRSAFKILSGKPIGKRPLGKTKRRWEDHIRMDLKEICINKYEELG